MSSPPFAPPSPFSIDRPRPQFQAALNAAMARAIVTLSAPGGFGKTCALRLFWHTLKRRSTWLNAREASPRDLTAALDLCGEKGLLVVDACEQLTTPLADALATAIDTAGPGLGIILAGRNHALLPLARWRSQGRVAALNAHHLAASQQEWQDAGLDGASDGWCGWWGARLAAVHPAARRDPELAAWLADAWLGALADETIAALGRAALLPEARPEWLMALGTGSQTQAESTLLAVAVEAGPLCLAGGGLRLAPRFRPYLVEFWRSRSSADWLAAVETGTTVLLGRNELALAAELAIQASDATGEAALPIHVLREAGWRLLFSRDRPWLRKLLDATSACMADPTHALLEAAWRVEVTKRPHDAEADATRLAASTDAAIAGPATALLASIAHQYDGLACAEEYAHSAMRQIGLDLHPAYALAERVAAGVHIALGNAHRAEASLTHVLACASRDKLDHLQMQALHERAMLNFIGGNFDIALRYCIDRRQRIRAAGLDSPDMADPSARLEATIHLLRLDTLAARRVLAGGRAATDTYGDYWHFPYTTLDTLALLIDGDSEAARPGVEHLEQEIAEHFVGLKWRAEALLARLWLRARDADNEGLLEIAARTSAENWPDSIYRDRRDLLCAAAHLLAGASVDTIRLQTIAHTRAESGAANLAAQARRLLALAREDVAMLLEEVRLNARHTEALDWLWLAPRALAPLEALLAHPKLGADAIARPFLRSLVQRLLAPVRGDATSTGADKEQAPPAGLTPKEWTILQLIGEQFTNDQIAAKLFVSLATVKTHINHIYSKLDIRTRVEAVHRARTLGSVAKP